MKFSVCNICDIDDHSDTTTTTYAQQHNDMLTAIGHAGDNLGRAEGVGEWMWFTHSPKSGKFLIKYIIYCILNFYIVSTRQEGALPSLLHLLYFPPLPCSLHLEGGVFSATHNPSLEMWDGGQPLPFPLMFWVRGHFLPPTSPLLEMQDGGAIHHPFLIRNTKWRSTTTLLSHVLSKGVFSATCHPPLLETQDRGQPLFFPLVFQVRGYFLPPAIPSSLECKTEINYPLMFWVRRHLLPPTSWSLLLKTQMEVFLCLWQPLHLLNVDSGQSAHHCYLCCSFWVMKSTTTISFRLLIYL